MKGCIGKVCTSRLKHFKLHVKPIEQVIYHIHQRQSAINLQKNNVQQRQRECAQRIGILFYIRHKSLSPQVTISYKDQSGEMLWQSKYELISLVTQTTRNCLPICAQIVAYQQAIAGRPFLLKFSLRLSYSYNKSDLPKSARTPFSLSKP